jgi:hypothetical protein
MTTIIYIKQRMMLRRCDRIAVVTTNCIKLIFDDPKVAAATHRLMMEKKVDGVKFDDDSTIIQFMKLTEEELVEKIKKELDSAKKGVRWPSLLSYDVQKQNGNGGAK